MLGKCTKHWKRKPQVSTQNRIINYVIKMRDLFLRLGKKHMHHLIFFHCNMTHARQFI